MEDIIFDTKGQANLLSSHTSDDDPDSDEIEIDPTKIKIPLKKAAKKQKISSGADFDLDEFMTDMGWKNKKKKQPKKATNVDELINEVNPIDEVLKKSAIFPGFEKAKRIPAYDLSDKKLKKLRRRERDKTKGKKWFNLPAPEMTEEVKRDLEVIQMRSALDPKHFYKRNDMQGLPKYFQIGKVVDAPLDYYNSRLTKKERKRTIVDELMADAEFAKYNKRKYQEIIAEKNKLHYKAHRHARRLKGKKK